MASNRQNFLSSQVEPGNANEPCRDNYIFPARIALSSEATPPFMSANMLKTPDMPLKSVEPYRFTLRRLREGFLYVLGKAGQPLTHFAVNEKGMIEGKDWLALESTLKEFFIVYSQWIWDEEFQKKVSEHPGKYMQKVTLTPGSSSVGTAAQIGALVEEYRKAPGKVVSLRGFSKAKAEDICDSESVYADEETYAPQGEHGERYLTRRWQDGYFKFFWAPLKEGVIPEAPCPEAQRENRVFLLTLHDSVGIAREFASLHAVSVATISARNDWYAYPHTMALYAKTLLEANPSYGQHVQGATKGKVTLTPKPAVYLCPRDANELAWPAGKDYRSKLPAGMQGHPIPGMHNGQPIWYLQPYVVSPAEWDVRGINAFLDLRKNAAITLAAEMKTLTAARAAWLGAEGTHSFVATMRRGSDTSISFFQRREEVYADCHAAFTEDEEGQNTAETLYLKGRGDPAKLFKDVMAGKIGQNTFVPTSDTLATLIRTFGFYLSRLPEAEAIELHDAWDARLYPDADPEAMTLSLRELAEMSMREGLSALRDTDQENKEAKAVFSTTKETVSPAGQSLSQGSLPPRKAAGKPLEFYIREELIKASEKWVQEKITTEIKSRCLAAIKASLDSARSARTVLQATKAFERHMKYWALCQAMTKFATDTSLVSFLKLGKAVSSALAVRRTRATLATITRNWGATGKWANGVIVLLGRKSVGMYIGLGASLTETYSMYEKDDYDAAAMTAGTAIATVALALLGGGFSVISVPVTILGEILAGYWKNSVDEDWLTHSYWGQNYKGNYYDLKIKKSLYPSFSYQELFKEAEKKNIQEETIRHPEVQPESLQEHGSQQRQWISMMSEPTVTCAAFADFAPDTKFESFIYVKATVRFFDPLQSSIAIGASVATAFGKRDVAVSSTPNECMPIPFRLVLETQHEGETAGAEAQKDDSSDLSGQIQTISLEGVFSIAGLQKITKNDHIFPGDFVFEPQLGLDMSFKYLPEIEINKHKDFPINVHFNFYENDMGDSSARTRYKTLLKEMTHDAKKGTGQG